MTPKSPTKASFVHNVNMLVNGIMSCNKEVKALLVQLYSNSISWEEKQMIKLQIEDKSGSILRVYFSLRCGCLLNIRCGVADAC
jgi:hypothetical protein